MFALHSKVECHVVHKIMQEVLPWTDTLQFPCISAVWRQLGMAVPVPCIPVLRTENASAAASTALFQLPAHTGQEQPKQYSSQGSFYSYVGIIS